MQRVTICSLWRNDAARNLEWRARHLAAKRDAWDNLRLIWVTGDCADNTFDRLTQLAIDNGWLKWVKVINRDSGILGADMPSRLRRLSATCNECLRHMGKSDYMIGHESDLVTPADLVPRFMAHAEAGRAPIAGWPTLTYQGFKMFYDVWAYRKDGRRFNNFEPYHPSVNGHGLFTVDSFGSCYMVATGDLAGFKFTDQGVLDLCAHLRGLGRQLWVDRTIEVVQPAALWKQEFA